MTLSASNIVQVNSGSTGSANASSVTMTLPTATSANHELVAVLATSVGNDSLGRGWIAHFPSGFSVNGAELSFTPVPQLRVVSKGTTAGETSWVVSITNPDGSPGSDAICWWIAEVSGLHADPATDPNVGSGAVNGSTATTLVITDDLGVNGAADEVCVAAFANRIASGTPKTVSSIANTTTQPGTWTRLGTTAVTTKSTGPNVRLDVYDKFPGAVGKRDATVTWSASVIGAAGLVNAYTS